MCVSSKPVGQKEVQEPAYKGPWQEYNRQTSCISWKFFMTKKWIGINFLLFIIAAIAGYQLYVSVQLFEANNDISNIKPAESRAGDSILPPPPPVEQYTFMDFADISDKNVFSETRTKGESTETPASIATLPDSQKPTLVGVILSEKQKVATLLEPGTRGRSGQTLLKKIGDTYAGYTITEIESDYIVLDNGDQKVIVDLNDISQPASSRKIALVSTRVIPIGGGTTTTASVPVIVGSNQARSGRPVSTRTTPQQAGSATGGNSQAFIVPVPAGDRTGAAPQPDSQPPQRGVLQQNPETQAPNTGESQGRTRIIRTPFGEIIRDR